MRVVGDKSKGGVAQSRDASIELAQPVGSVASASKYDHWTVVVWPGLVHVGSGTAHQYEGAWFEVVDADRVCIVFFELACRGEAASKDAVVDGGEVRRCYTAAGVICSCDVNALLIL